jgi:hypothetical protein
MERIDAHYLQRPQVFKMLSSPLLSRHLGLRWPMRWAASAALHRQ